MPLILCAALLASTGDTRPTESDPELAYAEKVLREAGVGTDNPALLRFFRNLTPSKAGLAAAVKSLGEHSYRSRKKATVYLKSAGRAALPVLRTAAENPDLEVRRRAERCIRDIENGPELYLVQAAARLLGGISRSRSTGTE
jgi:hypothetical protein